MRNQPVILVVDDEPIARKSIQALLEADEYVIEGAVDGPEALAKVAELQPDTIVMDVMMPGMDGYEVCSKIKATPLTCGGWTRGPMNFSASRWAA
jgi:CheY-like chemotaxis protein